ncbi:ankyrin [Morchella conica CCBAS932]|uniref:Ankyrin n=1 Tax=Morchella conica CCBAS932 TaxID=1392247 RepID=A0A3N4KBB0_9PEZI|nr:ankyrin [Morchella conica CCBAS932]
MCTTATTPETLRDIIQSSGHLTSVELAIFALKHASDLGPLIPQSCVTEALRESGVARAEVGIKAIFQESLSIKDGLQTIQKGLFHLIRGSKEKKPDIIAFALERVAELNAAPAFHDALTSRVTKGSLVLIALLYGVNTYGAVVEGSLRAFLQPDDSVMVRILLEAGAGPDRTNGLLGEAYIELVDVGQTTLHAAVLSNTLGSLDALLNEGFDINSTNGNGETALHLALQRGCVSIAKTLMGRGAAVNVPNILGNTPLIIAAARKIMSPQYVSIIDDRLSERANMDVTFSSGETILHVAAVYGDRDLVWQLLEAGANPSAKDEGGRTADQCTPDEWIVSAIRLRLKTDRTKMTPENDTNISTLRTETGP